MKAAATTSDWLGGLSVGFQAVMTWAVLMVLSARLELGLPDSVRSIVGLFVAFGNVLSALMVVAYWLLGGLAVYACAVLVCSSAPPVRPFLAAVGIAQAPVAAAMFVVWIILLTCDMSIPAQAESAQRYMESMPLFHLSRGIMAAGWFSTMGLCIWNTRIFFGCGWPRAACAVLLPLAAALLLTQVF